MNASLFPRLAIALACMLAAAGLQAATLTLDGPGGQRQLDSEVLAHHAEARDIAVPRDASYHRAMRYRAVPLAVVLRELGLTATDTLEVVATDGFVAQLPGALALQQGAGKPQPWLAIEPKDAPWPVLPDRPHGAGPMYIVWPVDQGVSSEQWPYAVARLHVRESPERRWPEIAVAASLPADAPARRGQAVFIVQCLTCHAMNGAGGATMGPDLNRPMSPVEYFQPQALRQLVRNSASVRRWPAQAMPAFSAEQLSDASLDDLIAYLQHMAGQRQPAR
ncbi:MAG: c-type cytochrome [Comamonas sp.]